jgi:hypothetical protein
MSATETKTLLELLRRHYIKPGPLPGGVFIPECGQNGGTGAGSRADALYVGFTSTSGRLLVGHELKVSRADWRRELDLAGKADFWADNCHQWWIVAPGPEVVPKEEIPHGWGLLYPGKSKTRMQVIVKAETRPHVVPSWQAVRSIMARLDTLRAASDAQVHRAALEKARQVAKDEADARAAYEGRKALTPEQDEKLQAFDRIEQLLQTKIKAFTWKESTAQISAQTAAAALRFVLAGEQLGLEANSNEYQVKALEQAAKTLLRGLTEFADAREAILDLTLGRSR